LPPERRPAVPGHEPLRHPPGAPLDGRQAAEPGAPGGPGRAGGGGRPDDGEGPRPPLPDAGRGGPGAGTLLQEGGRGLEGPDGGIVPGPTAGRRTGAVRQGFQADPARDEPGTGPRARSRGGGGEAPPGVDVGEPDRFPGAGTPDGTVAGGCTDALAA